MKLSQFTVWYDNEEQWDADDIDEGFECQATNHIHAAEQLLDSDCDQDYSIVIVRDDTSNVYRHITLVRSWAVKSNHHVTLEELCAP